MLPWFFCGLMSIFQWPFHKGAFVLLKLFSLTLGTLICVLCPIHCVYMCAYSSIFFLSDTIRSASLILFSEYFQHSPKEHQASSFLLASVLMMCIFKDYHLFLASVLNAWNKDLQQHIAMKYQQRWKISGKIHGNVLNRACIYHTRAEQTPSANKFLKAQMDISEDGTCIKWWAYWSCLLMTP